MMDRRRESFSPSLPRLTLPSPCLFDALDADARAALAEQMQWFSLPGGSTLFRQGDPADSLYLVLSGALGVLVGGQAEVPATLVAEIQVGETVGEMALLTDRPRSASVVALRDTTLICVTRDAFTAVTRTQPAMMLRLTALLVERLERTTRQPRAAFRPRTLALVPLGPGVAVAPFAVALAAALSDSGFAVRTLDTAAGARTTEYFHHVERAHDLTLYQGDAADLPWTRLCLRRADRILYLGTGRAAEAVEAPPAASLPWRKTDLVLLHDAAAALPAGSAAWRARFAVDAHHHVRRGRDGDIHRGDMARLARIVTGRAVGLVLSGGGARGYGHVGVVRALREIGIPIDLVGGTSFGSIIAACVAYGWDDAMLRTKVLEGFVHSDPLNDYAVPVVALTAGRKVTRRLRMHFGESQIEDLWLAYYAVAANLSTNAQVVLRSGVLWRAIRASIAIPGLLPPSITDDEVLVDGGVMNNLPTDVMRRATGGPIIAVDVAPAQLPEATAPTRRPWTRRLLAHKEYDQVGIVSLLLRAATVSSEAQARLCRDACDLLLVPPLSSIGLLDWRGFERAEEIGYRHTMERADDLLALLGRTDAVTA